MIDVGQGDAILIESNATILIDAGGNKNKDIGEEIILPVLKSRGIHSIDLFILTHGDFDHAGSVLTLLQKFKVKAIVLNKGSNTELEEKIINYAKLKKIVIYKTDVSNLKVKDLNFKFLNSIDTSNENEDSLVTYTKINSYNILLMGDTGEKTEKEIINKYNLPKLDILKVGHHGSKYSTTSEFVKKLSPKYAIISVGKNNMYGHPSQDVIERLKKVNTTIYETSRYGSIEMSLGDVFSITTCLKPATQ